MDKDISNIASKFALKKFLQRNTQRTSLTITEKDECTEYHNKTLSSSINSRYKNVNLKSSISLNNNSAYNNATSNNNINTNNDYRLFTRNNNKDSYSNLNIQNNKESVCQLLKKENKSFLNGKINIIQGERVSNNNNVIQIEKTNTIPNTVNTVNTVNNVNAINNVNSKITNNKKTIIGKEYRTNKSGLTDMSNQTIQTIRTNQTNKTNKSIKSNSVISLKIRKKNNNNSNNSNSLINLNLNKNLKIQPLPYNKGINNNKEILNVFNISNNLIEKNRYCTTEIKESKKTFISSCNNKVDVDDTNTGLDNKNSCISNKQIINIKTKISSECKKTNIPAIIHSDVISVNDNNTISDIIVNEEIDKLKLSRNDEKNKASYKENVVSEKEADELDTSVVKCSNVNAKNAIIANINENDTNINKYEERKISFDDNAISNKLLNKCINNDDKETSNNENINNSDEKENKEHNENEYINEEDDENQSPPDINFHSLLEMKTYLDRIKNIFDLISKKKDNSKNNNYNDNICNEHLINENANLVDENLNNSNIEANNKNINNQYNLDIPYNLNITNKSKTKTSNSINITLLHNYCYSFAIKSLSSEFFSEEFLSCLSSTTEGSLPKIIRNSAVYILIIIKLVTLNNRYNNEELTLLSKIFEKLNDNFLYFLYFIFKIVKFEFNINEENETAYKVLNSLLSQHSLHLKKSKIEFLWKHNFSLIKYLSSICIKENMRRITRMRKKLKKNNEKNDNREKKLTKANEKQEKVKKLSKKISLIRNFSRNVNSFDFENIRIQLFKEIIEVYNNSISNSSNDNSNLNEFKKIMLVDGLYEIDIFNFIGKYNKNNNDKEDGNDISNVNSSDDLYSNEIVKSYSNLSYSNENENEANKKNKDNRDNDIDNDDDNALVHYNSEKSNLSDINYKNFKKKYTDCNKILETNSEYKVSLLYIYNYLIFILMYLF